MSSEQYARSTNQSLIYGTFDGIEKEDVKFSEIVHFDSSNSIHKEIIKSIKIVPRPKDNVLYDYIQATRLLTPTTRKNLDDALIFTSEYSKKLKNKVTQDLFDILFLIQYEDAEFPDRFGSRIEI